MISVLLCGTHNEPENVLRQVLSLEKEFLIVASRDSTSAVLPIALNLEPDLLLIEDKQEYQIVNFLNLLKGRNTHTSVMILNAGFSAEKLLEYFRAGAYDVIPAHMMAESLSARLRHFVSYFQRTYSEEDLAFLHNRVFDAMLFDALVADVRFVPGAGEKQAADHAPFPVTKEGWFRAVYISLHSDSAEWPYYCIYELRIIEDYLRKTLQKQFQSVAVIPGNIRMILLVYDPAPVGDLSKICLELQDYCRKNAKIQSSLQLSFGIGLCGNGLEGVKTAIRTARYASLLRFNEGYGHIVSYSSYFGRKQQLDDFLSSDEKERLTESVHAGELDNCIRAITDIFGSAPASEFLPKATAVYMILFEAFEVSVVRQNELALSLMDMLQSVPAFLQDNHNSAQAERDLKSWVIRCFRAMSQDKQPAESGKIAAAKQYIAENYLRDLNLQQAADFVNLSVPYFCTEFRKECGMSFIKYVNNLRLERASELLLSSDQKVAEIAVLSGFQDARHFSRLFRANYGKTPSQYRAEKQEETG